MAEVLYCRGTFFFFFFALDELNDPTKMHVTLPFALRPTTMPRLATAPASQPEASAGNGRLHRFLRIFTNCRLAICSCWCRRRSMAHHNPSRLRLAPTRPRPLSIVTPPAGTSTRSDSLLTSRSTGLAPLSGAKSRVTSPPPAAHRPGDPFRPHEPVLAFTRRIIDLADWHRPHADRRWQHRRGGGARQA